DWSSDVCSSDLGYFSVKNKSVLVRNEQSQMRFVIQNIEFYLLFFRFSYIRRIRNNNIKLLSFPNVVQDIEFYKMYKCLVSICIFLSCFESFFRNVKSGNFCFEVFGKRDGNATASGSDVKDF